MSLTFSTARGMSGLLAESPGERLKADRFRTIRPDGETFAPCGAAAFYDRARFVELGGFDERFFCYCEDVDYGFRVR